VSISLKLYRTARSCGPDRESGAAVRGRSRHDGDSLEVPEEGRVRQRGVKWGVASGLHFQAALGVICSGRTSSMVGVARAAMPGNDRRTTRCGSQSGGLAAGRYDRSDGGTAGPGQKHRSHNGRRPWPSRVPSCPAFPSAGDARLRAMAAFGFPAPATALAEIILRRRICEFCEVLRGLPTSASSSEIRAAIRSFISCCASSRSFFSASVRT